MDIGAACKQCRGRGFIDGGPLFAYPGAYAARQACDWCHGTGRNDAHSATLAIDPLDMPVPGAPGATFRDLERHAADLVAGDEHVSQHVAAHGRFWLGEHDYLHR